LGQAELGVELLTTETAERADQLAKFLHGLNEQRQTLEKSVHRAAN
jgi:single-stranded-DNA-specific exonuclease